MEGGNELGKKFNLVKVVYFDEQAALDSLEIIDGGASLNVIKSVVEKGKGIGLEAGLGKKLFELVNVNLSGNVKNQSSNLVENQITSTLMSQFIQGLHDDKINLLEINSPNLIIQDNSNAYYRNLLAITKMIGDLDKLSIISGEEKEPLQGISFTGMHEMLDSLSGYYELEGKFNDKPAIFRFNIDGLRNNYNLSDLVKMSNLTLYGVEVGNTDDLDLTFSNQMDRLVGKDSDKQETIDFDEEYRKNRQENLDINNIYLIIDVILAGIKK